MTTKIFDDDFGCRHSLDEPHFYRRESDAPGVYELQLETPTYWAFTHTNNAPTIIEYRDRYWLAAQVVNNIRGARSHHGYHCIKFGPGGRRLYCEITDELVQDFLCESEYERAGGANKRERVRNARVEAFALCLIDLLPSAKAVAR